MLSGVEISSSSSFSSPSTSSVRSGRGVRPSRKDGKTPVNCGRGDIIKLDSVSRTATPSKALSRAGNRVLIGVCTIPSAKLDPFSHEAYEGG